MKVAIRSLLSTPGPTLVVIAMLGIAIGVNSAMFSVLEGVVLRPLGYGDDGAIVVLWGSHGVGHDGSAGDRADEGDGGDLFRLSPADYRDVRSESEAFRPRGALPFDRLDPDVVRARGTGGQSGRDAPPLLRSRSHSSARSALRRQ